MGWTWEVEEWTKNDVDNYYFKKLYQGNNWFKAVCVTLYAKYRCAKYVRIHWR